jgi:hypothetical protein
MNFPIPQSRRMNRRQGADHPRHRTSYLNRPNQRTSHHRGAALGRRTSYQNQTTNPRQDADHLSHRTSYLSQRTNRHLDAALGRRTSYCPNRRSLANARRDRRGLRYVQAHFLQRADSNLGVKHIYFRR